jgi:methionyl-tRNA formyltransferase
MGLRVVFMGTPEFAVASLNEIIGSEHEVVSVVSVPDRKSGRGLKVIPSAVCSAAKHNNIDILQPEDLNDKGFIDSLKSLNADVFVVVAFRMLPQAVFTIPQIGTFNLHASLLPQYRGAAPINWAVINGEKQTGATTFFIDEKMDTGEILLQESININETDSVGDVHDASMIMGSKLVVKTLDELENKNIQSKAQDLDSIKDIRKAPKIFKSTCLINWSNKSEEVYNLIRGLSPYPAAFTKIEYNGKVLGLKIFKTHPSDLKITEGKIDIIEKKLFIGTKTTALEILELQLEGKKRMKTIDFFNGIKPELLKTNVITTIKSE